MMLRRLDRLTVAFGVGYCNQIHMCKTKTVAGILSALGVAGEKVLVVTDDAKPMLEASLRNLPGVSLVRAEGLNVYDCLRHSKLVMTKAALSALEARLLARKDEVDPT